MRVVVSLVSLVFFLAVLETVLRLAGVDTFFQNRFFVLNRALDYPEVFEKDKDLFWRLRPDQTVTSRFFEGKTYRINSFGLRGDEIKPKSAKLRIITLGNSCTFGWGVDYESTYAERLATLLSEGYEVINAGVPGYSSLQGRRFFEQELLELNPDIITILFAWNDHWAAANGIADNKQEFPPEGILFLQNLLSRLHTYRFLKKQLLSTVEAELDSVWDRPTPVYRVGLSDYHDNLIAICRTAKARGIKPILLTSPIPSLQTYYPPGSRSNMHRYHERYNEVVREVASAEEVGLVDLAGEFDKFGDLWDNVSRDPFHFNARGHSVAAERIAAYILTGLSP
jgi:lysophospholipase L1-like esterase